MNQSEVHPFLGILSTIYKWIWNRKTSWFGDGGWYEKSKRKKDTATTTATTSAPPTTSTSNWFQALLDSEEDDGANIVNESKYFTLTGFNGIIVVAAELLMKVRTFIDAAYLTFMRCTYLACVPQDYPSTKSCN